MQGGTYINDGGALRRVGGTQDHPDGNRARDAGGSRLNRPKEGQHRARLPGGRKNDQTNSAPVVGAGTEA